MVITAHLGDSIGVVGPLGRVSKPLVKIGFWQFSLMLSPTLGRIGGMAVRVSGPG